MLLLAVEAFVKIALVIAGLMGGTSYLVLLERRMAAWIQDRRGPNRVGIPLTKIRIFGLGQPIADGVKFIFKEEFTPGHVNRLLYFVAPVLLLSAALAVFAVVPFGSVLPPVLGGEPIELVIAPGVNVGMLYVFAVGGIAVYGVILGAWASNNKYAFYGGLRSAAQLISYEIPLGLGVLGVVLMTGSLQLDKIITQQAAHGWNVLVQPLGFFVFAVAALAESGRLPFDLSESEQELVGGYHTEYSGIKLMMFLVAEFLHMIVAAFLIVILFFGGWHLPWITGSEHMVSGWLGGWLEAFLRVGVLLAKVLAVILFFMVARWSWPRFRFDQLMVLAWKVMLPLGMVNLVVLAVLVEYGKQMADALGVGEVVLVAAVGWITLVVSWVVTAAIIPAPGQSQALPIGAADSIDAEPAQQREEIEP
ncbi:MAG: NADH-quinone oxidoreductase subunit NuoH [Planctomycetes bacterium]|nr:NADH-quinone oxidoreductase subunit NuoH [Planctomycetota bacterium]